MGFTFNFDLNFGQPVKQKDFLSFCADAGYPKPYPDQVKFKEFIFDQPWTTQVKVLLGSRGYGKTDYATILGSGHELQKNRRFKIIVITKEKQRGKEITSAIIEALEKNGVHRKNKSTVSIILAEHRGKDPNLIALPIRAKGFRGRHPDLIICDDPITPEDSGNAERKRVKVLYEELLKLCPRIAIIGQPVHKLDLYQELRGIVPTLEIKYGAIPELDADLEAQRAAGVSERSIQASYFLNLEDDLSMPFLKMELVDYFPAGETVAFIDPAAKGGKDRDCTAITVGRVHFDGNFVAAGFVFHKAWEDCLLEMREIFSKFNTSLCFFEDNICGSEPVKRIIELGMPCRGHTAKGNKHGRIMRMAIHSEAIKLHRASKLSADPLMETALVKSNQEYAKIVREYEYGADFDDAPDSLAGLLEKVGLIRGD